MIKEVFELLMQVHEDMEIACVGLMDGSSVKKEILEFGNGSRVTDITVTLDSTDVGYAVFKKDIVTSSIYNGEVQGRTEHETKVAVPYENISYVEFAPREE